MSWLVFRQNRMQIAAMVIVAVLLAIAMAMVIEYANRTRVDLGIDSCLGLACVALNDEWQRRVGWLHFFFYANYVFPALVASYVGGPLFATEFERGTHRLAWTQSIGRVRWAAFTLGIVVLAAFVAALVLAPFGGGQRALINTRGNVTPFDAFEIEGLALISYAVFGIAAAAFFGAWSRRILIGMFAGLLFFGLVRVGVHNVRPAYQEPVLVSFEMANQIPRDAWFVEVPAIDSEGRPVPRERVNALVSEYHRTPRFGPPSATNNDSTYLAERGVFRRSGYQPADRYWTFQAIEAAIFTGLAAIFALLTLWRVRTRDA